jgi:general secretion pathway protein I
VTTARARGQGGFTLLEVMVAFVILAASLGLLLGMLSRGLHQVTAARSETEATLHAHSLLDQLGTLEPLAVGARDGEFDDGRYRWRLQVAPAADPAPPPPPAEGAPPPQAMVGANAPVLYRVRLDVEWGDAGPTQQLHLETLRLRASPEGEAPEGGPGSQVDAADADAAADAAARQRGEK